MDKIVISGGKKLKGEVCISGAKNAAVAIIPATVLSDGICRIENIPNISDITLIGKILAEMGAKVKMINKDTLEIDPRKIVSPIASYELMRHMRASYYLMGAFLGKFSRAVVSLPGGCNFGVRPIDQHLKGFVALGADYKLDGGMVHVSCDKLKGNNIYLDVVSVGATVNIMLAAVKAEGTTVIENAAKEPHIVDTANFLNFMGANIKGAGTDVIRITGVKKLHGAQYTIIPDQIEAGTYMIASAITGGDVLVKNIIPKHMDSLSAKLVEMNVKVEEFDDAIRVVSDKPLRNVNVKTMSYPGFPTDLQPQMAALLSVCQGTNIITENVWENRFQYIDELRRMGANITVDGRIAVIEGVPYLTGSQVSATDLRAGAAMILAGLAAKGETHIDNTKYIDRGYEDVEHKFSALGAEIKRVQI